MTFSAVGTIIQTTTSSLTVNPATTGNLVLVGIVTESGTVFCNGISGGNCTWAQVGTKFLGSVSHVWYVVVFAGTATATGSAAATLSFSGSTPTIRTAGQQFSSTVGSWVLDVQGFEDSSGTPSLTPAVAGELYWGYSYNNASASAGSTSGYVYQNDAGNNGMLYNVNCSGSTQSPTWADSNVRFGSSVLMKETTFLKTDTNLVVSQAVSRAAFY